MSVTAKSVILDIADNWVRPTDLYMAIRSVEFALAGNIIPVTSGFAAYATSSFGGYTPAMAFNTTLSKVGSWAGNSWVSGDGNITNQRLIIVFDAPITFDQIVINNGHTFGGYCNCGAKNIKISVSTDAVTNATYNAAITNSTVLWSGIMPQHVASDVVDPVTVWDTRGGYITISLVQPYSIEIGDFLATILEQQYAIPETLDVALEQIYSIVLEIWITQIYGDVPELLANLVQPYRSPAVIKKILEQPWADALQLETSLEQSWLMPAELGTVCDQRYGIAAAVLFKTSEQLYHINANSTLFVGLSQPYALAGEMAQLYDVDTKLYIDGVRTPFISGEWQNGGEYALSCDFVLKGAELAARCVDGAEMRIDSAGESWFFLCVGGWQLDKRYGSEVYRVTGYSKSRILDYCQPLFGDIPGGMASKIVADLAAPYGISVDWQMADGYIADGKLAANGETPLAIIREIVWDAKGKIMSTLDGNLLIVAEEETAIPDYPVVEPADTIIARLDRVSTSEQSDIQAGHNKFTVSDQLASGGGFNTEYEIIDSETREIRLFITPIDGREFELTTSGGEPVTIEPCGIIGLPVIDELVEFVAGAGRTKRPIYGISAMSWQRDNLGVIKEFTEDGILTSEISGNSLLKISYLSRYHKWIGRDKNIESVQFIVKELEMAA